jgi:hypothetical protein
MRTECLSLPLPNDAPATPAPASSCRAPTGARWLPSDSAASETFAAELGGQLTEIDRSLIAQAANLVLASERFQADVVNGAEISADALVRVSSEARRILATLRTKAKNKPAGQTLQEYLAEKYGHAAADDANEAVDGTAEAEPAPEPCTEVSNLT